MASWDASAQEKQSQKWSALLTVGIQLLLLLGFYFLVVWKPSVPPKPTYGLELNLGFSDLGSGEETSTLPTDVAELSSQNPAPGEITEQQTSSTAKNKPTTSTTAVQAVSAKPSPLKGETAAVPTQLPATSKADPIPQKVVEQPKVDQRAIFGAGGTSGKGAPASSAGAQGSSKTTGDEGKPTGTAEGRALQGAGKGAGAAGSAGYSLDLAGWDFASRPSINDKVSTRNGRIVFKITVDDSGKVIQALPLEYNVSNEVLAYYRQVVNRLDFKKSGGASSADFSSGKITFVIRVD